MAITARTLDAHPTLPGSLNETAAAIEAHGRRAVPIVADLTDADDRARIVREAEAALDGPLDVLVNNAAAAIYQPLADYPLKRRRLIFEANVHAPLDLAQAVLPGMIDRGEGWIVNLSSGSARSRPGPPFAANAMGSTLGIYGAVEGRAQPDDQCPGRGGVGDRRPGQHRRAPGRGALRGGRRPPWQERSTTTSSSPWPTWSPAP